ncbi:mll7603 [Mesorhizobium japonicum MAFF 303099]|uniref:Mll7603 protein n=2 Tax=Mesorhizobium japonicum TaxID=2066070 RepID=Q985N1_RHILO|nr:mll7603 [Mesorhizobium japonicum MAFF 303099]
MRTISKLFDSRAEASRVAGELMAVGIPRVQIAIIGPYQDELAVLRSPSVILGTVGAALACLSAMAVYGVSSLPAGLPATALVCAVCGGGGLLGAFMTTAAKSDERSVAEGIVLVTAHVDENGTGIAQAVLGGCAPTAFIAEAA